MNFKDKLDFLFKITQTSNKELANGISVDPSLISLLRSGKRKKPKDPVRIRQMALFFAGHCTAEFQRNALAEMLGQTALRSSMPAEALADYLTRWLQGDPDFVEQFIDGISDLPDEVKASAPDEHISFNSQNTDFYFGAEGRRKALRRTIQIMKGINTPCPIFANVDDHMDWLLSDYTLSNELQSNFMAIIKKGFTVCQIMPAMNFLNRYIESLRFWLPMYSTGQVKVFYYPRLRDNLYRHSNIIVPGHYVQTTTTIGLGNTSQITLVSSEPELVREYTLQFQEHLSLCRPALVAQSNVNEFFPCFLDIFTCTGMSIQMVSPLSVNTMPAQLLDQYIKETEKEEWKHTLQMYRNEIPHFEERLQQEIHIDMSYVATAEEVLSGEVCIASSLKTDPELPRYTPETYILHLQNILRLMEQYEHYYFLPYPKEIKQDYNLIVSGDNLTLLIRTSGSPLLLEIHRPEMVMACREHLMRIAERYGYDGIQQTKVRMHLNSLIQELRNHLSE